MRRSQFVGDGSKLMTHLFDDAQTTLESMERGYNLNGLHCSFVVFSLFGKLFFILKLFDIEILENQKPMFIGTQVNNNSRT